MFFPVFGCRCAGRWVPGSKAGFDSRGLPEKRRRIICYGAVARSRTALSRHPASITIRRLHALCRLGLAFRPAEYRLIRLRHLKGGQPVGLAWTACALACVGLEGGAVAGAHQLV